MPKISIIIPVFNEEDSLKELHREISAVAEVNQYQVECVFVDDGSTDRSWSVLSELAECDSRVQCIQFRRNFGKAAALRAGAETATGSLLVTMDADLQDDPSELPSMLEKLGDDYDLISGWKRVRHDPPWKNGAVEGFQLVGWFSDWR